MAKPMQPVAYGTDQLSIDAPIHGQEGQESAVERAAPWVSSFLMHAALGLVGAFVLYAAIRPAPPAEPGIPPVAFPLTTNPDEKMPTGQVTKESALTQQEQLESMQKLFREANHGADPFGSPDLLKNTLAGMGDKDPTNVWIIAGGTDASMGPGRGIGQGDGPGGLSPFGPGTAIGPTGTIFPGVPVRRVVYLLDHSGSMLDSFDYLREEVKKATTNLRGFQQFSVIMFSEDVTILGPDQLQRASDNAKRDIATRLAAVRAHGQNDGLLEPFQKGFEKAFAMKPEMIIFLTDGEFDPRLVDVVKKLNHGLNGQKVQIHTIAYVQIGVEAAESLKKIAGDSGGKYKFVGEKDLK